MKLVGSFFLREALYKNVYDEFGDNLGKLVDIYVTTEDDMPRAIGYKVKNGNELFNYEFKYINFYRDDNEKLSIRVKGVHDIIPRTYSYLLSKHLLNKKIIDINGKKFVKAYDLKMAEIAGELKVIAVDTGTLALSRRLSIEPLAKFIYKLFNKKPEDSLITWDNIESLEMTNNSIKLSVPYQKLSKLHPADLADILEKMDTKYRKLVLESFEDNLAADILEEVEPHIQVDILENLSNDKIVDVLESMPNDEIADMLEEADSETVEKVLMDMGSKDAEEVRTLMNYGEEFVGSIMNKDFLVFNINITVQDTLELLKEINPEDEVSHYIYIIDGDERLKGAVSLKDLVMSDSKDTLSDIMNKSLIKIKDCDSVNTAVEATIKYDLISIPVVNNEDKLCGIVLINDVIEEILAPAWKKKFKKVV